MDESTQGATQQAFLRRINESFDIPVICNVLCEFMFRNYDTEII